MGIGEYDRVGRQGLLDEIERLRQRAEAAEAALKQFEHARGAGYCGYQWGMGARNHGGGCEEKFTPNDETYRCLDCGGVFHKCCLEKHFAEHSGETKESLKRDLATEREARKRAEDKIELIGAAAGVTKNSPEGERSIVVAVHKMACDLKTKK